MEKEIARLDVEYQEALEKCIPFADRAALYRTVPGVGPLTSATLVAYLPELGCWDGKSLTSLVGLAPWSRDSGKKRGNRAIRGGRRSVRSALYLCAWSVIRHDSELRRFYQNLRQRGKPGNVALVAVMRKLLLRLNAVARRGDTLGPEVSADHVFLNSTQKLTFNTAMIPHGPPGLDLTYFKTGSDAFQPICRSVLGVAHKALEASVSK